MASEFEVNFKPMRTTHRDNERAASKSMKVRGVESGKTFSYISRRTPADVRDTFRAYHPDQNDDIHLLLQLRRNVRC